MKLTPILLVLVLLYGAGDCGATSTEPPSADAKPEPFRLPFLLDAHHHWLQSTTDDGWLGADVMLRMKFSDLFSAARPLDAHQLLVKGGWDHGYGLSPQPDRFHVVAGYQVGVDFFDSSDAGEWDISLSRRGAFPLTRSSMFSFGLAIAGGYFHGKGLREAHDPAKSDSLDAARLEGSVFLGIFIFELYSGGAFIFTIDDGRSLEGEVRVGLRIGRPYLPVAIDVGYTYLSFERTKSSYFTLGVHVAF